MAKNVDKDGKYFYHFTIPWMHRVQGLLGAGSKLGVASLDHRLPRPCLGLDRGGQGGHLQGLLAAARVLRMPPLTE